MPGTDTLRCEQGMARAWRAWREDAAHSADLKQRLAEVVVKWQQQQLRSTWAAYREYVYSARTLRMVSPLSTYAAAHVLSKCSSMLGTCTD